MACGVHLGILLICFVQAEHVRCLWAAQAQSSKSQNGNAYAGFSQQESGNARLGSRYPQNQLRLASVQSRLFNTGTAANSGYAHGHSQPASSGYGAVQSSQPSKANWQVVKSNRVNAQPYPRRQFTLSTAIAGSSSVGKKSGDLPNVSKTRTWPVGKGAPHASKYVSSSSASVRALHGSGKPSSFQSSAQWASSAVASPQRRGGSAPMTSSLYNNGAPKVPPMMPTQSRTSATVKGRKVFLKRPGSKPSGFYSNTKAGRPQNQLFGGQAQASYKPTYVSTMGLAPVAQKRNHLRQSQNPSRTSETNASIRIFDIPERFGGVSIRRKGSAQNNVNARKPQQTYTAPSQQRRVAQPQAPSADRETKWKRLKPTWKRPGVSG